MTDLRPQRMKRIRWVVLYGIGGLLITVAIAGYGAWMSDLGTADVVQVTPSEWDFDDIEFTVLWDQLLADRYIAVEDTRADDESDSIVSSASLRRTSLIIDETGLFALAVETQRLASAGRLGELYDGHPNEAPPLPYWFKPDVGYDSATATHWMLHLEDAAGWPFRALRSRMRLAPIAMTSTGSDEEFSWSIPLSDPSKIWQLRANTAAQFRTGLPNPESAFGDWTALPLLPIWLGMFADTIIWAAALFASLWLIRQPARLFRKNIGHCPKCNYNLHGIDSKRCPECGAAVVANTT